jgi:malonyl CoA-acyl carrier protein transacylase
MWKPNAPEIEQLLAESPDVLQLAIYGISVATYRVLAARGLKPDILMGHSFGEIAAMVCAGAFTVSEGAEIVCERCAALAGSGTKAGYMAAIGADADMAGTLVALAGNHEVGVASENHPGQTVVSGSHARMDTVGELARVLQLPVVKLNSPYPFHSPLLRSASADFGVRLRRFRNAPLQTPVFSPILGRTYTAADVLTNYLAEHLVRPVRFASGVQHLYAQGVRTFVECGALDTLTKLVMKAAGENPVAAIPCLDREDTDAASLDRAFRLLGLGRKGGQQMAAVSVRPDGADPAAFDVFWAQQESRIRSQIAAEFAAFLTNSRATPAPALRNEKPAVPTPTLTTTMDRGDLFREIASMYAAALEYPVEVFTDSVELEAELGIDSVKQTELLGRVAEAYNLPPRPPEFRLANYHTMGKVVDFVLSAISSAGNSPSTGTGEKVRSSAAMSATAPVCAPAISKAISSRDDVLRQLVTMYAAALEYPEEVFTDNVELEGELGIDSVKQTELLGRVSELYALPPRPAHFRLRDYHTIGKVADFVHAALTAPVLKMSEPVQMAMLS